MGDSHAQEFVMSIPLYVGRIDGVAVAVEASHLLPDAQPVAVDDSGLIRFEGDLLRLGQGIEGAAQVDGGEWIPLAGPLYFSPYRSPSASIRSLEHASAESHPVGKRRFFLFHAPGAPEFHFALSLSQVLEVYSTLPLVSLGFPNSFVPAAAVWRGRAIPLVDLAAAVRLGNWDMEPHQRGLVVRNSAGAAFAIPVSGSVHQPSSTAAVFAPDAVAVRQMRAVRGVFRYEGRPLLVPDLDALLG